MADCDRNPAESNIWGGIAYSKSYFVEFYLWGRSRTAVLGDLEGSNSTLGPARMALSVL